MTATVATSLEPKLGIARRRCRVRSGLLAVGFAAILTAVAIPGRAADIIKGRQIYLMHCASCHGATGISVMPGAPSFARNESMFQPDMTLVRSIRNGKNVMPAYMGILTDREMFDVVAYLRTLR